MKALECSFSIGVGEVLRSLRPQFDHGLIVLEFG